MTTIKATHSIDRSAYPAVRGTLILDIDGTEHVIAAADIPTFISQVNVAAEAIQLHNRTISMDELSTRIQRQNSAAQERAAREAARPASKPVPDPGQEKRMAAALEAARLTSATYSR